jgi:hypothetical protein
MFTACSCLARRSSVDDVDARAVAAETGESIECPADRPTVPEPIDAGADRHVAVDDRDVE